MTNIEFKISKEKFFNNGLIMLKSMPSIENEMRGALCKEEKVVSIVRTNKGVESNGISAASLNQALRRNLENCTSFKGETHVENGIFFNVSKEGFDFASFDEKHNKANLFNYYMGSIGILKGDEKIYDIYGKMKMEKNDWAQEVDNMQTEAYMNPNAVNIDYECQKEKPTIVGEFQFGNWALIYRDLFRLLDAANNPGVDLYIYVTADSDLSNCLSAQTVSFRRAVEVIDKYQSIIKTPIWLIGLGFEYR